MKIQNKQNNKVIHCECLYIDNNFIKKYNRPPRFNIDRSQNIIVINAWYRKKLGDLETQKTVDLEILPSDNLIGKIYVCLDHPQVVVRLATQLGLLGVVLGFLSFVISIIK